MVCHDEYGQLWKPCKSILLQAGKSKTPWYHLRRMTSRKKHEGSYTQRVQLLHIPWEEKITKINKFDLPETDIGWLEVSFCNVSVIQLHTRYITIILHADMHFFLQCHVSSKVSVEENFTVKQWPVRNWNFSRRLNTLTIADF